MELDPASVQKLAEQSTNPPGEATAAIGAIKPSLMLAINAPKTESSRTEPLLNFICFPQLPSELRLKIWGHAIKSINPRILELEYHKDKKTFLCPTPSRKEPLGILQTCRDSRREASKTYEWTTFGAWLNLSVDTLYLCYVFDPSTLFDDFWLEDNAMEEFRSFLRKDQCLRKLKHLAIWFDLWDRLQFNIFPGYLCAPANMPKVPIPVLEFMQYLPELEQLAIVFEDNGCTWESGDGWITGSEIEAKDSQARSLWHSDDLKHITAGWTWLVEDKIWSRTGAKFEPPELVFRSYRRTQNEQNLSHLSHTETTGISNEELGET